MITQAWQAQNSKRLAATKRSASIAANKHGRSETEKPMAKETKKPMAKETRRLSTETKRSGSSSESNKSANGTRKSIFADGPKPRFSPVSGPPDDIYIVARRKHMKPPPKEPTGEPSQAEEATRSRETTYQLREDLPCTASNHALHRPEQYRLTMNLTKKEIELLRYTWDVMVKSEQEPLQNSFSIPGGFSDEPEASNPRTPSPMDLPEAGRIRFCTRLFMCLLEKAPSLKAQFPLIKHQATAFVGTLTLAISQLEDLSKIEGYLSRLGNRHARILKVEPAHFELLGESLVSTFHEVFGAKFTPELEKLWIRLYLYLANSLIQAGMDPSFDPLHEQNNSIIMDPFRLKSLTGLTESIFASEANSMYTTYDHTLTSASTIADSEPSLSRKGSIRDRTNITKNKNLMKTLDPRASNSDDCVII